MKFQKNKDGFIEVEYNGLWYFKDGNQWILDFKIPNSNYYSTSDHPFVRRFVIPVGTLSTKEAQKVIRKVMKQYEQPINFDGASKIQIKLNQLLREEKLNHIKKASK